MKNNRRILSFIFILVFSLIGNAQENKYQDDFEFFWQTINDNYAYFDKKQTDWNKVKEFYAPRVREIKNRSEFVRFLEIVLRELYDNHTQLNTNLSDSSRLVPSGADIWAEWKNDKAVITELRKGFGAEKSGLKIGMEIISFNSVPINKLTDSFIGKSLKQIDVEAKNQALNSILAGDHLTKRYITTRFAGETKTFAIDEPEMLLENISYSSKIEFEKLENNIGYIKINNSLGDNSLIGLFDNTLAKLSKTAGLILDLRETPSGGNSTVGRAILSRFIKTEMTFQKHSIPSEKKNWGIERSWFEIVSPRGEIYEKPVVVLVNRWTGSMGEGIVIGFDGMKRAKIVGTKMARLAGATETFTLPNTKIRFNFPTEKIFHINGQPREEFLPNILVETDNSRNDTILEIGIKELNREIRK